MDKLKLMKITNEVRKDIVTAVHSAKAGHPGGSLSAAEIITYLYFEEMNIDPKDPGKDDRDRLGQGISTAVGMAIAAKLSGASYRVYTVLGDGELQEGQVWEASMLAAHRGLDNLVVIVDNNNLQIDGEIDKVNSPYPIDKKFEAFNFHVINIDGNDFDQIESALKEARGVKGQPTAIIARTLKGKGVSFMENAASWHGKAPNDDEYKIAMADLEKAGEALCQM